MPVTMNTNNLIFQAYQISLSDFLFLHWNKDSIVKMTGQFKI